MVMLPRSIAETQVCPCWFCLKFEKDMNQYTSQRNWGKRRIMQFAFELGRGEGDPEFLAKHGEDLPKYQAHGTMANSIMSAEWEKWVKEFDMYMFKAATLGYSPKQMVSSDECRSLQEAGSRLIRVVADKGTLDPDPAETERIRSQLANGTFEEETS